MNTIRPAKIGELNKLVTILLSAIQRMAEKDIFQWDEYYPNKSVLQNDIEKGHMNVLENAGTVIGFIVFNEDQYPGYKDISWSYAGRILAVHRLVIDPAYQGKKLSSLLMDYAEQVAASKGYDAVRLDAFVNNPAAIALYEGRGYRKAGTMSARKGTFICYEKLISAIGDSGNECDTN